MRHLNVTWDLNLITVIDVFPMHLSGFGSAMQSKYIVLYLHFIVEYIPQ